MINLGRYFADHSNRRRNRIRRSLPFLGLGATLFFAAPCFADSSPDENQKDWSKSGLRAPGTPIIAKCETDKVVASQLIAYCVATNYGLYWRWYDFDIHTCTPNGESYRVIAWTRTTGVHCNLESYKQTKKHTDIYKETWLIPPDDVVQANGVLPGPMVEGGTGREDRTGDPEELPKLEKDKSTAKTTTGSDEKKRPRKEVKHRTSKHRRAKIDNDQPASSGGMSPETARTIGTIIDIGIGVGLSRSHGHSRGREGRDDAPRRVTPKSDR